MNKEEFEQMRHETSLRVAQDLDELLWMMNRVEGLAPKRVLEIGVEDGGTLKCWEQVSYDNALIIGVDIRVMNLQWDIKNSTKEVHYVQGDSHDSATVEMVKKLLNGRLIDFLFIDGDHSIGGVEADWNMFSPLVRVGGLVGFHDIGVGTPCKFFDTLSGKKATSVKSIGIGYIIKE